MGLLSVIKAQVLKPSTAELRYQALDVNKQEIRVLEILPQSERKNGILACRLQLASLKSVPKPQYETISYTWGDSKLAHRLVVNDQVVLVPVSAKLALERVAFADRSRTVWIDAICIKGEWRRASVAGQPYGSDLLTVDWESGLPRQIRQIYRACNFRHQQNHGGNQEGHGSSGCRETFGFGLSE